MAPRKREEEEVVEIVDENEEVSEDEGDEDDELLDSDEEEEEEEDDDDEVHILDAAGQIIPRPQSVKFVKISKPVSRGRKSANFNKEIRALMYGVGDCADPHPDSVRLLEELLRDYMLDLCTRVSRFSKRPKTSDFLAALSATPKQLHRARELLAMDKELKSARAVFDVNEMAKTVGTSNPAVGSRSQD